MVKNMRILNNLFKVLSWLVIAVIVVYMAIAAPIIIGYHPMIVLSGSMEPTFPIGSVVYYHKCKFENLTVGTPITFKAGDALVTHRITTVNGISRTVVTKGDNNETEDSQPVEETKIVGEATKFAIPYAGYFVTYGKKPVTIIIMAVILLINYALESLYSGPGRGKKIEEKT